MKKMLLLSLLLTCALLCRAQVKCCDDAACKVQAAAYAVNLSYLTNILGSCDQQDSTNKRLLQQMKNTDPASYNKFVTLCKEVVTFTRDPKNTLCFQDALSDETANNVNSWLIYMDQTIQRDANFPSVAFCRGWEKRVELAQGAANILSNKVAYLGSVRGYITYTFAPPQACGGRFRLLAGPAFFLRGNTVYTTLSTRVAMRAKDLALKKMFVGLGNLNIYAEYNTSFVHFNQVALGAEIQLGAFGVNAAVNNDLQSARPGFSIGVVLFHSAFKNKK
ncbi:hypothetical protein [Chitinophaga sp. MM2321]|uniref:hypothetical protein n=1 Tax=Chitinophaga sp. MM2321 TaxID=3137178 RepID=UPI0032D5AD69